MPYQNICIACSNIFTAKVPHQITCSKECRKQNQKRIQEKHYYKDKEKFDGNCLFCKQKIENKPASARYCSDKCERKFKYHKNKKEYNRTCIVCNKEYISGTEGGQYCSNGCVNTAFKKHEDVTLTCKECNKEFKRKYIHRDKLFCSRSCATNHQNRIMFQDGSIANKISHTKKENFASGKTIHPWIGKHHSEETKEKLSKIHKEKGISAGENNPMYGKRGEESPIYGIKRSKEVCELMSEIKSQQWLDGKYNGVDFRSFYKRGYYKSYKMHQEMYFRSSYEEKVFHYLDKENNVAAFFSEPFRLPYYYQEKKRHYLPDILVEYLDGTKKLVEIKPSYLCETEINKCKFAAAREYCEKNNIIYEIWTENEIDKLLID